MPSEPDGPVQKSDRSDRLGEQTTDAFSQSEIRNAIYSLGRVSFGIFWVIFFIAYNSGVPLGWPVVMFNFVCIGLLLGLECMVDLPYLKVWAAFERFGLLALGVIGFIVFMTWDFLEPAFVIMSYV